MVMQILPGLESEPQSSCQFTKTGIVAEDRLKHQEMVDIGNRDIGKLALFCPHPPFTTNEGARAEVPGTLWLMPIARYPLYGRRPNVVWDMTCNNPSVRDPIIREKPENRCDVRRWYDLHYDGYP